MAITGTRLKVFFSALLSVFLVFALVLGADAADDKKKRAKPQLRRVQAPGPWAAKRIIKAQEALATEQWAEALEILQEMKDRKKLKGIETATMWQFYGFIYSSRNPPDYKKALVAFENALKPGALPQATQTATYMNVAQLYVMQERYSDALRTFDKYFANTEDPSPDAYYMYAIALTQKGSTRKAIPWAIKAINASANPKEPWLQLLSSLYFETKQYRKAVSVLEILVARFPKKNYFIQLAALNNELGKEQRALAVLELAFHQDMLDQDSEYRNLAQLFLAQEIPYQAALVLQKGMRSGTVKKDRKAYDMISQAWLLAREREKAIDPLTRSAARSKKGEAYLRLAQLHLDVANWSAAEAALQNGLKKGGLKKPALAHILLGIAQFNQENWEDARDSFFEAREYEKSKETATQWLKQVGRHIPVDLDEDDEEEVEVIEMVDGIPAAWYDLPAGDRAVLIGGLEAGIIKIAQPKAEAEGEAEGDEPGAAEAVGGAGDSEEAAGATQPSWRL
jgi:tetratricopeptide (TPR) repeat protein